MGKRSRIDKRAALLGENFSEHQRQQQQSTLLAAAPDASLFVLDDAAAAAATRRKRARSDPAPAASSSSTSSAAVASPAASRAKFLRDEPPTVEGPGGSGRAGAGVRMNGRVDHEQVIAERAAARVAHHAAPAAQAAEAARRAAARVSHEEAMLGGRGTVAARDVWADEAVPAPRARTHGASALPSPRREAVLGPGASYHPEAGAHQDALGEALARIVAVQRRRDDVRARVTAAAPGTLALDDHDPDEADPDLSGKASDKAKAALASFAASADSTGAVVKAPPAGHWTKRKLRLRGSRKKAAEFVSFEAALLAAQEEVAARDARDTAAAAAAAASGRSGRERELSKHALAAVAAAAAGAAAAVPLRVSLSEDLRGSLRAIKPVPASGLVLERMEAMAASGQAHRRSEKHAAVRLAADGSEAVRVLSHAHILRAKNIQNPYKLVEFPRRRGFAPADAVADDAMRTVHGLVPKKR